MKKTRIKRRIKTSVLIALFDIISIIYMYYLLNTNLLDINIIIISILSIADALTLLKIINRME